MAKTSMVEREKKRAKTVARYKARRAALKEAARDPKLSEEERREALEKLQALPRDASPVRMRNRCSITGRSRGYYRKFGLGRSKLREAAMNGEIPGLSKASW
ncbi:MAG: 30S ribosomal protein S14 [Gammaproteobacteria bacterium]